jgi:hypothetical protein
MIKTLRVPSLVLALACIVFVFYLFFSAPLLPDRVATHFAGSGQPNGWMSRSGHLLFTGLFGLGLPLFTAGICYAIRFLPATVISLPRRKHWLAPRRREETFAYLFRHSLWMASLEVGFVAGIHYLVVRANLATPVSLSTAESLGLVVLFAVGAGIWIFTLIRHFMKK